jgi:hypothetical protein
MPPYAKHATAINIISRDLPYVISEWFRAAVYESSGSNEIPNIKPILDGLIFVKICLPFPNSCPLPRLP